MSGGKLPAVRIPATLPSELGEDESNAGDSIVVELPSSNKFAISWPTEASPSAPHPIASERTLHLSSSDGEEESEEEELSLPPKKMVKAEDGVDSDFVTPTGHLNHDQNPMDQVDQAPRIPRLSRAFSMPLPSQLGSLQNPRRTLFATSPLSPLTPYPSEPRDLGRFQELSLELADSVQMVIQTLLQLSPPQVLDPSKEQFSACSLSIPTTSICAMLTSMKNLNYMSANMSTFGPSAHSQLPATFPEAPLECSQHEDFDIGEMLQSVGDALSGIAAQAGVDLVLFHGDVGMKHVVVKGDESGISYTLSHVRYFPLPQSVYLPSSLLRSYDRSLVSPREAIPSKLVFSSGLSAKVLIWTHPGPLHHLALVSPCAVLFISPSDLVPAQHRQHRGTR